MSEAVPGDDTEAATIVYRWRGAFTDPDLNALHAEAFEHRVLDDSWIAQVEGHSYGWVTAHDGDVLVGFVNVAWDGGVHAFLLDTVVAKSHRRRGIGVGLVRTAVEHVKGAGPRVAPRRLRAAPALVLLRRRPGSRRPTPASSTSADARGQARRAAAMKARNPGRWPYSRTPAA